LIETDNFKTQSISGKGGNSIFAFLRLINRYTFGALLIAGILSLPIIALIIIAMSGTLESFQFIVQSVLISSGITTIKLMIGVGVFVAVIGTLTAWLISFYDFPMRNSLQWALMLPLAVPTYISSYAFVEYFSYTGPLQEVVRSVGGYQSSREYWFPEIRSEMGAVFILGIVLYPYVYLAVRTLFHLQGTNITDTARVLGTGNWQLLFKVTIPLARPAIILGVTLALMETINDIGAMEHLGVKTLSFSIFSVWLNQSDLAGAAQIALFTLVLVFGLMWLERASRGKRAFSEQKQSREKITSVRRKLKGASSFWVSCLCLLPVLTGFGIPLYVLGDYALAAFSQETVEALYAPLVTTLWLGAVAAFITVIIGLFFGYAARIHESKVISLCIRVASSGYAVPGTLLALGIFIPLAMFDNALDGWMRSTLNISTGLLLTGSGVALIFGYVVRFMAISEGNISNGFARIPTSMDMAARSLGRGQSKVLSTILLPLMRPAIASAALMVFVEVIKELSATIMLRPFGLNTLATHVYDFASQARVEDAAMGCLLIMLAGAIPAIFILRTSK